MPESWFTYAPPSLPNYFLVPVAALTLFVCIVAALRTRERSAMFLIGSMWLRYIMSAFHAFTYRPLAVGLSANALASVGVFLVGLLTINWRHLALRFLIPFYAVIVVALASAVTNGAGISNLVSVLTKQGYLIVVVLSVFNALKRSNGSAMTALLWCFAPVMIYQLLSLVFGYGKINELDPSDTSFIGGYYHEAAFSLTLATGLVIACLAPRLNPVLRIGLVLALLTGIGLANYRTALVAIVPLIVFSFGFSTLQRFPTRDRPVIIGALVVFAALALGMASLVFADRFSDVAVLADGHVNLFKPPDHYTVEESRLFSGRPRIWSEYIYAWSIGGFGAHMLGYGPDAWLGVIPLYAHNTLVSYLYEYGLIGVAAILFLWLSMLTAALRVRHPQRAALVGAHLSYLMLNMSTMPMWMIEGIILYGVICGYTLYLLALQAQERRG